MNWRDVWVVFRTELTNTLRDRRTWFAMIIVPLILVPVLLIAAPTAIEGQMKKMEEVPPKVAVVGAGNGPQLVDFLKQSGQVDVITTDDPAGALREGKVSAVLHIESGFADSVASGRTGNVRIDYDASNQKSEMTRSRLRSLVGDYSQVVVAARLQKEGIDVSILHPVNTVVQNVAPEEKVGGFFLAMIMPMMLAVWAALGGMYAAIDAVAGEKERGTLEPLLATPPSRMSLVAGKYLTVVLTSVVAAAIAMIGMYGAFLIKPEALMGTGAGDQMKFSIPLLNGLLILGISVLLAGFFSALELAVSAFARSFREAQSYLSPISIVVVLPGIFTQFINPGEVADFFYYIPLLNGIFVFKELLMGIIDWGHITTTVLWSVVWIILALRFTTSIFKKESVLFRL